MRDWFARLRDGNAFEGPFKRKAARPQLVPSKPRPHAYTVTRWMRVKRWWRALRGGF
jgi:hypothetical protein